MGQNVEEGSQEVEIELKLLTDKRSARRVWSLAFIKELLNSPHRTRHIKTIYYDTPQLDLKAKGCALRLRSVGNRFEQHLKSSGTSKAGVFHRKEWQVPLSLPELDLNAWSGKPAKIISTCQVAPTQIFESDMERTDGLLCGDDFEIELAVDIGFIRSKDSQRQRIG